jgi:hypothetical protein
MDHPCYKCNQLVSDGTPFCRHCGAPQIRVAIAAPAAPALTATIDESGDLSESPEVSYAIRWSDALRASAMAALVASVLLILGLMVPLLAMLGAGFLTVILYRRRNPSNGLKATLGAQLGAASGVFCFAMSSVFGALAMALFHGAPKVKDKLLEVIQQASDRANDPQAQAVFDYFRSPSGMAVFIVFVLVFALLSFTILGAIGGAVGGAWLGRRDRR